MAEKDSVKKIELLFLFILIVYTLIFRMQSIGIPLDKSEGAYAYSAAQMTKGLVPYKDIFEHRPPFILYIYKTAFSIFGQSAEAIRYFTNFYIAAVLLLIYIFSRVLWRSAFLSMMAVFFYVIYQHGFVFQGLSANTAVYAQFPLVLSLLFALDRDKKYEMVNFCVSGFFAAVALLTHLMTGFFILAPVIYILLYCKENKLRNLAFFLAGYIVVLAAVINWALFKGILGYMYAGIIKYNNDLFRTGAKGAMSKAVLEGLASFAGVNIFLCIAILYSGWRLYKKNKDGVNFLLFASVITLYAGIVFGKSEYRDYYLILIPIAAVLCAVLVFDMYVLISSGVETKKYAWVILAMFLALNTAIVSKANDSGSFMRTRIYTQEIFYEERAMAQTIMLNSRGKAKKNNFLFAWPNMPELYFAAEERAASRYPYAYPLDIIIEDKGKALDALFNDRPSWIVVEKGTFQTYQAFLDNYYAKETDTKHLVLYRNLLYQ